MRGIDRSPVNSPHEDQWRGTLMFSLICAWINGWVNNHEAGDWRRHRAHYNLIVMLILGSAAASWINVASSDAGAVCEASSALCMVWRFGFWLWRCYGWTFESAVLMDSELWRSRILVEGQVDHNAIQKVVVHRELPQIHLMKDSHDETAKKSAWLSPIHSLILKK